MNIQSVGYLAATLTTLSFVPQARQITLSRDTRAISLPMYVSFTAGIALWFAYGLAIDSWPIVLSNAVTFVLSATVLALKVRHG